LDLSSNFIKDAGIKHLTRPLLYKRRTLQSLRLLHVLDVSDNPVSHRCITSLVCFEKLLYFAISYKKGAKKLWCKIAEENFGFVRTKVTNSAKLFFRKELKKSLLEPLPLLEGIPENFYIDNSDSNWPILTTRFVLSWFSLLSLTSYRAENCTAASKKNSTIFLVGSSFLRQENPLKTFSALVVRETNSHQVPHKYVVFFKSDLRFA
jgi:hypothetical protein